MRLKATRDSPRGRFAWFGGKEWQGMCLVEAEGCRVRSRRLARVLSCPTAARLASCATGASASALVVRFLPP